MDTFLKKEKQSNASRRNLKEKLETFYDLPIDEIYIENEHEIDTGNPVGNETW